MVHEKWFITLLLFTGLVVFSGCSSGQSIGPANNKTFDSLAGIRDSDIPGGVTTSGNTERIGINTEPIINRQPVIDTSGRLPQTLTNYHPGWQQSSCFLCHSTTSQIPDHNYTNTSLCASCHGTNGITDDLSQIAPSMNSIQVISDSRSTTISWKTNKPTTAKIYFGVNNSDEFMKIVHTDFTRTHSAVLEGLSGEATYLYRLENRDQNNKVANSADFGALSFSTKQKANTQTDWDPPQSSVKETWVSRIKEIFAKHCLECHSTSISGDDRQGAPDGINYNSFNKFSNVKTRTKAAIFTNSPPKKMPRTDRPPIPSLELERLQKWFDNDTPSGLGPK